MDQKNVYGMVNCISSGNSTTNNVIIKDEFNDLKMVDQYIPLEDVYVENLYPFNNHNNPQSGYHAANGLHYQYHQHYNQHNQHDAAYQEPAISHKPFYEDFKENNNVSSLADPTQHPAYMTSYYSNTPYYSSHNHHQGYASDSQAYSSFLNNPREQSFPSAYSHQGYYNFNSGQKAQTGDESSVPPDTYANTAASTGTANNHVKFLDADCDTNASAAAALSGEKPPEPYANIIVKAILSTHNNVMQLKDIYNFMIEK